MANLSPSELASLLGPIEHSLIQRSAAAWPASEELPQWNHFAEEFARSLTARLRPLVKAASRVQPSGRKSQTADAVIANHDTRSAVCFWQSNRSVEPLSIILSPPLVATFVNRLLGGRSRPSLDEPIEQRMLTEIDHRLAARLIEAARQCVIEAAAVELSESSFALNDLPPQTTSFEEAWLSDCPLLRLSFELRFVQGGGSLDLLIPVELAAAFASQNSDHSSQNRPRNHSLDEVVLSQGLSKLPPISVVAHLTRMTLSADDLRSLAVGDVLLTDVAPESPLEVIVGEATHFQAESGCLNGHKAIRLLTQV